MTDAPFDVARANRWFAIELNNLAWSLVEAPSRTEQDSDRMIHAAHASCHHWLQVGTPLNHQRAQCLLATAYAAAGRAEAAVRHAGKCLALSAQAAEGQTAFDRATALGCAARAYGLAGRSAEARDSYLKALEVAAGFKEPEEKEVFEKLYQAP